MEKRKKGGMIKVRTIIAYLIDEKVVANHNQLSKHLGVSHATVQRWATGEDRPSAESCIKIARLSKIPLSYIMRVAYPEQ